MDMESDTETDTETNVEIDTTWTRTWTWGAIHRHEDIGRYSRYSAGWITGDTSQRKFQQRYEFVAPFPNENYDMLIEKKSYRHQDISPNNMLAELEISVWGKKKAAARGMYSNWKLTHHIHSLL